MSGEEVYNEEGCGINRRSFLKSAGVVVTGSSLAAGLALAPESVKAAKGIKAIPTTLTQFRCPICGKHFATFAELKNHFAAAHPDAVVPVTAKLHINGKDCEVLIETHWTLQRTLQFRLGLTGPKPMCVRRVCGSCTTLALECEGKSIQAVEGIAIDPWWKPLIDAYCKEDTVQCGYCTPGILVSSKNLLDNNPKPTEDDCKQALAGNLCCCGIYPWHPTAIMEASSQIMKGA